MKKKLADEIGKAYKRLHCSHLYWHRESALNMGSFSRGVIVCNNCGKKKLIEQLKDDEVLVEPWRVKDFLVHKRKGEGMNKINEIIKIITDCEAVQNSNGSSYTKEQEKIHAYDRIVEAIGAVKEQEE